MSVGDKHHNYRSMTLLVVILLLTGTMWLLLGAPTRASLIRSGLERSAKKILATHNDRYSSSLGAGVLQLKAAQQKKFEEHYDDGKQSERRSVCTLAFLKQYAQQHGHYAKMPFSQINVTTTAPPPGKYDCWFDDSGQATRWYEVKNKTSNCSKNVVTSIVLLGDSNGSRYASNLLYVLNNSGWQCEKIKQENASRFQPDPAYYTREPFIKLSDIRYKPRPCHGCESFKALCLQLAHNTKRQLHIEYLSLQYFKDSLIKSRRTRTVTFRIDRTFTYDVISSATQQQFLFNEYLAGRYPDVVIFFISSHLPRSIFGIQRQAQFCFDTLDRFLPPTSIVIIASSMRRRYLVGKNPARLMEQRFWITKYTVNEVQQLLNTGGYAGAQSRLTDSAKRWYAFPNLFDHDDRAETTDQMYVDSVHRTPEWYQAIVRYMLLLVCVL